MLKRIVLSFLCLLFFASPALANDTSPLEFGEDGKLITDPKVENTYKIPDISAGFNWDAETGRVRGIMAMEVRDNIYIDELPYLDTYPLKIDAGVGEDLILTTVNIRVTSIIELSSGISYGYDFNRETATVGFNFLMTKF